MELPRDRQPRAEQDNLLPLINVVFLLLIFFMIAGAITTSDPFAVHPPKTSNAGTGVAQPKLISVAANGRYALNGKRISRTRLLDEAGRWARKPHPPVVRVKADGHLAATALLDLLQDLGNAGLAQVKLLTLHARK